MGRPSTFTWIEIRRLNEVDIGWVDASLTVAVVVGVGVKVVVHYQDLHTVLFIAGLIIAIRPSNIVLHHIVCWWIALLLILFGFIFLVFWHAFEGTDYHQCRATDACCAETYAYDHYVECVIIYILVFFRFFFCGSCFTCIRILSRCRFYHTHNLVDVALFVLQ